MTPPGDLSLVPSPPQSDVDILEESDDDGGPTQKIPSEDDEWESLPVRQSQVTPTLHTRYIKT